MSSETQNFGHWLRVYYDTSDEVVKTAALEMLVKFANDPVDATWTKNKISVKIQRWMRIFDISPLDGKVQAWAELAIHRLIIEKKRESAKKLRDIQEGIKPSSQ